MHTKRTRVEERVEHVPNTRMRTKRNSAYVTRYQINLSLGI